MMLDLTISQWGLIADMIGVLLLFKYGLPSKVITLRETLLSVGSFSREKNEAIDKINQRIIRGANIGLGFVFLGFMLQFIGGFK